MGYPQRCCKLSVYCIKCTLYSAWTLTSGISTGILQAVCILYLAGNWSRHISLETIAMRSCRYGIFSGNFDQSDFNRDAASCFLYSAGTLSSQILLQNKVVCLYSAGTLSSQIPLQSKGVCLYSEGL